MHHCILVRTHSGINTKNETPHAHTSQLTAATCKHCHRSSIISLISMHNMTCDMCFRLSAKSPSKPRQGQLKMKRFPSARQCKHQRTQWICVECEPRKPFITSTWPLLCVDPTRCSSSFMVWVLESSRSVYLRY